ncbi:hypothetical protein KKB44_03835 [Candidatus Micrarchaeota archaeon]|nr:hypothetical protein [Candidatus Micrarchaeota archaeon]
MVETQEMFFTLIWHEGRVKRGEITAKLSSSDDPNVRELANIGNSIIKVLNGEEKSATLSDALKSFDRLPTTDYWHSFMETSGQVLISKGLRMKKGKRSEFLKYGVAMVALAGSSSFPVSETTIDLLKKAKKADKSLAEAADRIIRQNPSLKPIIEKPSRAFKKKKKSRKTQKPDNTKEVQKT